MGKYDRLNTGNLRELAKLSTVAPWRLRWFWCRYFVECLQSAWSTFRRDRARLAAQLEELKRDRRPIATLAGGALETRQGKMKV